MRLLGCTLRGHEPRRGTPSDLRLPFGRPDPAVRYTRHLADLDTLIEPTVRLSDASRRIAAERILLLAWPRAILLQLAHPLIAAGVADHSSFRGGTASAFRRLHATIDAMLAITFGSHDEREHALDGIRAIHTRVHGTLKIACGPFAAGTPYSAEDPALLLWVHATLVESMVLIYEQLVAPLTMAERDQYCADSASAAIELGARDAEVPRDWRALRAYIDAQYATSTMTVGHDARMLAQSLLSPMGGPIGRSFVAPLLFLIAAGPLPEHVRRGYGFAWNGRRERACHAVMKMLRAARTITPRSLARWPAARSGRLPATSAP